MVRNVPPAMGSGYRALRYRFSRRSINLIQRFGVELR